MTPAYRQDIDGLRAVAVLLVLLFHVGVDAVPGGFIGVDVFFVVSGYLITTIIDREARLGQFSYTNFYRRRILRLMPALFAVIAATSIIAFILLFPTDLVSYGWSVIAATFSGANIYFWREIGGYFGDNAETAPLLHAWSLSVEEQYYFIWPALILLGRRWLSSRGMAIGTIMIFVASVGVSEIALRVTYGAAYYLLPTRMFELMVGSFIALIWDDLPRFRPWFNHVLSMIALCAVVASGLAMSRATPFPGIYALIPTIATGVLLLTGRDLGGVANRLLALKPLVWIGLVSYSLYLWHWPAIAFTRYAGIPLTPFVVALLMLGSLGLAWASWRFVEVPWRRKRHLSFLVVVSQGFALPAMVLLTLAAAAIVTNGVPTRYDEHLQMMDEALASRPDEVRGPCHSSIREADSKPSEGCFLGAGSAGPRKGLLLGDSHANHFTGFLDELAKPAGVGLQDYTLDGCLPLPELELGGRAYFSDACRRRNAIAFGVLQQASRDFVILSGNWPTLREISERARRLGRTEDDLKAHFHDQFLAAITQIVESGARPVIVKAGAITPHDPKCPLIRARFDSDLVCEFSRDAAVARDELLDDLLQVGVERWPQLIVIDPKYVMCPAEHCLGEIEGIPLYRDHAHLNDLGSRALGMEYVRRRGNPFLYP